MTWYYLETPVVSLTAAQFGPQKQIRRRRLCRCKNIDGDACGGDPDAYLPLCASSAVLDDGASAAVRGTLGARGACVRGRLRVLPVPLACGGDLVHLWLWQLKPNCGSHGAARQGRHVDDREIDTTVEALQVQLVGTCNGSLLL